jgi:DNA-directed RNA polymerase subunit RPC12/RpoP
MNDYMDYPYFETRPRAHRKGGRDINADFACVHCHTHISSDSALAGVNNRNHCPYCLYSRHLDLFQAGDRLSACRGSMQPVGLAFKQSRNKYGSQRGELMLVHFCLECGKVSVNRIAADDSPDLVLEIFNQSLELNQGIRSQINRAGACILEAEDAGEVTAQLYGRGQVTALSWDMELIR